MDSPGDTAGPDPTADPPPVTIRRWTGVEIRALRAATRLSVREFARSLDVSDRIVSRWESAGRAAILRPSTQARLDAFLAHATTEQKARFLANLAANDDTVVATIPAPARTRRVVDVVATVKDVLGRPDMRHALAVRDVATVFRILNRRGVSQRQIARADRAIAVGDLGDPRRPARALLRPAGPHRRRVGDPARSHGPGVRREHRAAGAHAALGSGPPASPPSPRRADLTFSNGGIWLPTTRTSHPDWTTRLLSWVVIEPVGSDPQHVRSVRGKSVGDVPHLRLADRDGWLRLRPVRLATHHPADQPHRSRVAAERVYEPINQMRAHTR